MPILKIKVYLTNFYFNHKTRVNQIMLNPKVGINHVTRF